MSADRERSRPDLAFGLAMLGVSLLAGWEAIRLRPSPFDPLGPGSFPKLVAALLGVLSLVLLARLALGRKVGQSETSLVLGVGGEAAHRRRPALAMGVCGATLLYVSALTFTPIGFLPATVVYLAALGIALSGRSRREVVTALAVAVVGGGAVALLFTKVLFVALP
jgi:putative tricarboxylic transport membrane protein